MPKCAFSHTQHNITRSTMNPLFVQAAGLSTEDLLFVRYEAEKPNVLPYFLALDHAMQTVVLAIRGSLSLDDVVRDLLIEPASLDSWISSGKEWHGVIPEIAMAGGAMLWGLCF